METRDATNELNDAVIEVLEVQAFMFAEPAGLDELDRPEGACVRATISFEGPTHGTLDMIFPKELCVELASNILGVEVEQIEDEEEAEDALKELLNIVCGQYLTRRYGSGPVYKLSIPQVEGMQEGDWEEWIAREGVLGFEVDFTPILVHVAVA